MVAGAIDQGHGPAHGSKTGNRKRVLTEDRRKQNRESQQRYRQRRKAKHARNSTSTSDDAGLLPFHGELDVDGLDSFDSSALLNRSTSLDYSIGVFFDPASITIPDLAVAEEPNHASISQSSALPSPYINYLQIKKLDFYAARIQNAVHIGLPVWLAQTDGMISPWYWDTQFSALLSMASSAPCSGADDPHISHPSNLIARPVRPQRCFELSESVMPDLSPTALQRTHPHELYIDMIPFPVFRDRVITLLAMDPPAFDEGELKRDIEAEGLLVWGVGQGRSDCAASLVRDRRNWECSRWFSKKWTLLVNGSGLEEQSRWWRRMRGDDESDGDS